MNLFISYFNHRRPDRKAEFERALKENCEHPLIDRILIWMEGELPFEHEKLKIVANARPTYHDFFQATKDYPEDINIIANSDIAFNETLELANKIRHRECFALTRTEYVDGALIEFTVKHKVPSAWSQDVWIFRGFADIQNAETCLAINLENNQYDLIKFHLGIGGCDNLIAKKILESGWQVRNVHEDIICIHYHESESRPNYSHRMTGVTNNWSGLQKINPSRL